MEILHEVTCFGNSKQIGNYGAGLMEGPVSGWAKRKAALPSVKTRTTPNADGIPSVLLDERRTDLAKCAPACGNPR